MRCFHAVGQHVLATRRYCGIAWIVRVRIIRVTNGNAERNRLKIAGHTHRKRNKRSAEERKTSKQTTQPNESPVGRVLTREPVLRVLRDRITTYRITNVRCRRGRLRQTMAGRYYYLFVRYVLVKGTWKSNADEIKSHENYYCKNNHHTNLYGVFKIAKQWKWRRKNIYLKFSFFFPNPKIFDNLIFYSFSISAYLHENSFTYIWRVTRVPLHTLWQTIKF